MGAITPPSIVTYSYTVNRDFDNYVNVSFPFRVKIDQIWFTGDRKLFSDTNMFDAERGVKLSALKARNPKHYEPGNTPSDWAPFFGVDDSSVDSGGWWAASADFKPTMWVGNPDNRPEGEAVQDLGQPWYDAGFRSTVGVAPETGYEAIIGAPLIESPHNPYWYNDSWSENEWMAKRYKMNMAIMQPDDILSLFIYDYTGDWSGYQGDAVVNIHIAYTGVGGAPDNALQAVWGPWW
jgi:hypothetical protein